MDEDSHPPARSRLPLRGRLTPGERGVGGRASHPADATAEHDGSAEMAAAELRYRQLVEGLPVIPYRDSVDGGDALYVSPRLEVLLGYTPQEWMTGGIGW